MATGRSSAAHSAAGYVESDDVEGTGTVNVNNKAAPRVAATGATVGDTGARLWLLQYAFVLEAH